MATSASTIEEAAAGAKSKAAREFINRSPTKLLIGSKWVPAKSGKTFETVNPANERVLGAAAEGDQADIDDAVKAARKAFEEGPWSRFTPHQRTQALLKLAEVINQHTEELAELITLDNGKTIGEAN